MTKDGNVRVLLESVSKHFEVTYSQSKGSPYTLEHKEACLNY